MTDADIDIAFVSAADGPDLTFLGFARALGSELFRSKQQPSAERESCQKYSPATDLANAIVVVDQSNLGFFLSLTW
jgi:hypothetical protein